MVWPQVTVFAAGQVDVQLHDPPMQTKVGPPQLTLSVTVPLQVEPSLVY